MNKDKTQLFHAGLNQSESNAIANYGFPIGSFPIRYLGLPLMYRKLRISEYSPLIDKIAGRFRAWSVKSLSFAGRLQLISSVISGTVNFWTSSFVLPRGCIRKINNMCSKFLWSGGIDVRCFAKVSWKTVCLPKKEGGLGLRDFSVWNTALCLRLIWLLFSDSGSLWVAWQKHHHLKRESFWSVVAHNGDSWSWKSLLKLRSLAERFVKCSLGNGQEASFWFDSWTPFGPLIYYLGQTGPRNQRIPINASVADASDVNGWRLANPRSEEALALHLHLNTIHIPRSTNQKDSYSWSVDGVKRSGFSSKVTWEEIRPREEEKEWYGLIWFKGATPKHAFMMWTAQLDRLPTRNRLLAWGMNISSACGFCDASTESRDHLLLHCPYTNQIWTAVKCRMQLPRIEFRNWSGFLLWLKSSSRASPTLLRKLVARE